MKYGILILCALLGACTAPMQEHKLPVPTQKAQAPLYPDGCGA